LIDWSTIRDQTIYTPETLSDEREKGRVISKLLLLLQCQCNATASERF